MAVLGAAAGLEADDALDLDLGAAPLHPHVVREGEQVLEAVVGKLQDFEHLALVQRFAALENLLTREGENVCLYRGRGHTYLLENGPITCRESTEPKN